MPPKRQGIHRAPPVPGRRRGRPPNRSESVSRDENKMATVDRILDHRFADGTYSFRVTWLRKPEFQATWVTPDKLSNSIVTLKRYFDDCKLRLFCSFEDGLLAVKEFDNPTKNSAAEICPKVQLDEEGSTQSKRSRSKASAVSKKSRSTETQLLIGKTRAEDSTGRFVSLKPITRAGRKTPNWRKAHIAKAAKKTVSRKKSSPSDDGSSTGKASGSNGRSSPEMSIPTCRSSRSEASTPPQRELTSPPPPTPKKLPTTVRKYKRGPRLTFTTAAVKRRADAAKLLKSYLLMDNNVKTDTVPVPLPRPAKNASKKAETDDSSRIQLSMVGGAVTVTEGFVFEDPSQAGRKPGFELGWTPDRIVAVVPNSYPKKYVVKWEGCRIVEHVDKAVLMEKAPRMLVSFLEDHV